MRFLNGLLVIFLLGLPACSTVPTSSSSAASAIAPVTFAPNQPTHIVAKGETLWSISRTYQVDLEDLARLNRLSNEGLLSVGQKLALPFGTPVQQPATNFADTPSADFIWPVQGKILAYFQQKNAGVSNKGIDIATRADQDVVAARSGHVAFVGRMAGYGNTIIIDHADGLSSVYCGPGSVNVKMNDDVTQGTVIAKAGTIPRFANDALHFEIRKRHKPINPLFFLD